MTFSIFLFVFIVAVIIGYYLLNDSRADILKKAACREVLFM